MPAIVRIVMTLTLLVMIVMTQRPCSDAVSGFVTGMDGTTAGSGSATVRMPKPGAVDVPSGTGSAGDYESLRPGMTDAEIKAAIERAKARAAGGTRTGSSSAGSSSAGSSSTP